MSWYKQWKVTLSKTRWIYSAGNQMRAGTVICETWKMSTSLWQFDLSRHALSFSLTSLKILVILHMLENNSEVLAWENLISHVCFLEHWMFCLSYTLVIGSCEVWPEVSYSSLSPCKESHILGICNGKLCNIISVVSEGTACFQMLSSKAY